MWPAEMKLSAHDFSALTPGQMRDLIVEYQHHSPLVRALMIGGYHHHENTLDTLTKIAFAALQRVEVLEQATLDAINLLPAPPIIVCQDCAVPIDSKNNP